MFGCVTLGLSEHKQWMCVMFSLSVQSLCKYVKQQPHMIKKFWKNYELCDEALPTLMMLGFYHFNASPNANILLKHIHKTTYFKCSYILLLHFTQLLLLTMHKQEHFLINTRMLFGLTRPFSSTGIETKWSAEIGQYRIPHQPNPWL